MTGADPWADRAFLRGRQYRTDANLAARQSIYAYQHPRIDLPAAVLGLAAPAPGDTLIDVGCGNGTYLAELIRRGFAGRLLGVDLSFGMLMAARRLAGAPARPLSLANGDAAELPLRDGVADVALAPHMLYHVPDPAQALRELRRVTRPGGRVAIVLNDGNHLRELRAVVATARGDASGVIRERVTLDDGLSMAKALFPKVTRHDFAAELRVPAPGPIADYVRSMSGTSHHANPELVIAEVLAAFPRTPDGHFVITSHSGCLICETG